MKTGLMFLLLIVLAFSFASAEQKFKAGDKLPEFDLPYATKDTIDFKGITSETLLGDWYLLAFYPADWSPGCTREMCTFRDEFSYFEMFNVEVFPISGDYVFSHFEWAKHHNLNFRLLADHTRKFGNKMGVYIDDYGMFQRSVFLIDPEGKLAYIDYEYSLADETDFNAMKEFIQRIDK